MKTEEYNQSIIVQRIRYTDIGIDERTIAHALIVDNKHVGTLCKIIYHKFTIDHDEYGPPSSGTASSLPSLCPVAFG